MPTATQASRQLRVAILISESAGTLPRLGAASLVEKLRTTLDAADIAASISLMPGAQLRDAAEKALRQAQAGEVDAVMAGGGDGSIRTVAGVLAGTGVPLGVLPLGTLNHFARDLAIPLDIEGAVAVLGAGAVRDIDIAAMNGEVFLNNSSIGAYPFLVLERERRRRRLHLSKWTAMLLAASQVLRHLPLFRLTIRVEGAAEACRSPLVFIGNNEYQFTLPAFGRRERLDGAELSVYIAKAQTRWAFLGFLVRAILGFSQRPSDMHIIKTRAASIESRRHHLLVAFDGEVELLRPPLHYEIRPRALRVFAAVRSDA